jgi:hypothetical protein
VASPITALGPHSPSGAESAAVSSPGLGSHSSQTVHLADWGLQLDYPAGWQLNRSATEGDIGYITILAFLGTGTGQEICTPVGPTFQCYSDIRLGDNQVVLRLSELTQRIGGPFDPAESRWLGPGQTLVTVGGLPAGFSETTLSGWYQSDVALIWDLSAPGSPLARYEIRAYIKGPDVAGLRAEVERLVASVRFDPGPAKLNPTDGPLVATRALAELSASNPGGFCYPETLGVTSEEIQTIFGVELSKPLPVTCTAAIEPSVGLWKLTVTMSWDAAADRNPGSYALRFFLTPGGVETWSDSSGSPVPYWPAG